MKTNMTLFRKLKHTPTGMFLSGCVLPWLCRLFVCVFVCLLVCLFACLFVCVCVFVCLFVCWFVSLFVCLVVSFVYVFVCSFVSLFDCLFVCLFVVSCVCAFTPKASHCLTRCVHVRHHVSVLLPTSLWSPLLAP